jgi:hypothetical protein
MRAAIYHHFKGFLIMLRISNTAVLDSIDGKKHNIVRISVFFWPILSNFFT